MRVAVMKTLMRKNGLILLDYSSMAMLFAPFACTCQSFAVTVTVCDLRCCVTVCHLGCSPADTYYYDMVFGSSLDRTYRLCSD